MAFYDNEDTFIFCCLGFIKAQLLNSNLPNTAIPPWTLDDSFHPFIRLDTF